MKIQVTLFCSTGEYKPISTIINANDLNDKKAIYEKAILNICHQRHTNTTFLKQQHYTQIKIREYNIEEIEKKKKIEQLIKIHQKRI